MCRAAGWSVLAAVVLAAIKLAAFVATGSIAQLATVIDSFSDIAASSTIWWRLHSRLPAARQEQVVLPGRTDAVAAIVQAAFVVGAGLVTLGIALRRILYPIAIHHAVAGLAIVVVSILATLGLLLFQRRRLALNGTLSIVSDRVHYESDLLVNGAAVLALIGAGIYGVDLLDPLIGAVVAGYLSVQSFRTGREAVKALAEQVLPADLESRIETAALATPGVRGLGDLCTRDTAGERSVELHVEVQSELSVIAAQGIADRLAADIEDLVPGADVRVYPVAARATSGN